MGLSLATSDIIVQAPELMKDPSEESEKSKTELAKAKDSCLAEEELRKVLSCSESRNWEACPFLIPSDQFFNRNNHIRS